MSYENVRTIIEQVVMSKVREDTDIAITKNLDPIHRKAAKYLISLLSHIPFKSQLSIIRPGSSYLGTPYGDTDIVLDLTIFNLKDPDTAKSDASKIKSTLKTDSSIKRVSMTQDFSYLYSLEIWFKGKNPAGKE